MKETLLLLWSWRLGLLGAWLQQLSQQPAWRQWRVRKTKWLVGLVLTVTALGGANCSGAAAVREDWRRTRSRSGSLFGSAAHG